MKVGIVTIHNADNYGAVLQAYALKSFIEKQNEKIQVNIIDYNNQYITKEYRLVRTGLTPFEILRSCQDLLELNNRRKKIEKFKQFRVSNLNLTENEYFNCEQLEKSTETFDIYVSGSDQIWNPSHSNNSINGIYYLDFAPKSARKISYASSFGYYEFSDEQKRQIAHNLSGYSYISCRELDGVALINEIIQKDVEHVLDPVFLLKKDEWENLLCKSESNENYVLVYTLGYNKDALKIAQKIANDKKLKIYFIASNIIRPKCADRTISNAGPIDFLKLFFGASYVVTNSFHGTGFSVIFNKNFVTLSPGKKVNRIKSLLSLVKLEDRILGDADELEKLALDIDYSRPNIYLEEQREKSIAYLKNAVGDKIE
jgi:hypothetical protein